MKHSIKQFFLSSWIGLASLLFLSFLAGGTCLFSPSVLEKKLTVLTKKDALAQFYQLPLYFEKNEGQIDASVKYLSRGPGYTFYFTPKEVVMVLQKKLREKASSQSAALKIQFVGAAQPLLIKGLEEQECKSNYFKGNDPMNWRTNISNYAKVRYEGVYPGIDVVFYGNQQQFEYDFCLAPGADPQLPRLHIEGAKELAIDAQDNLHITMKDGEEVQMLKPFVYQMVEGKKLFIESQFTLLAQNDIGFILGSYDQSKEVVIDPVLVYSTYLGGTNIENGSDVAIDSTGHAYVVGTTGSTDFPVTAGAFQTTLKGGAGGTDAFVTKFDVTGNSLIYSTYLGGSVLDSGAGIAIDSSGNAYVTGMTSSSDFPITANAFQSIYGGITAASNAFMTKLNNTGSSLLYSTFLGGGSADEGNAIAVDSSGNAYIVGSATSNMTFPISPNAFQSTNNTNGSFTGFVTKINPSAVGTASLVYSTFLGGNVSDSANGVAVDSQGHAYVVGTTSSANFPFTPGAFQTHFNAQGSGTNAFVTKLNLTGSNLIYSTFLGGSNSDNGDGIALLGDNAYVTGHTYSADFPVTPGAFQETLNGAGSNPLSGFADAFVTQFNVAGSELVYSTFLGGSQEERGFGIAVDTSGNAYIVGETSSTNFPVTTDAIQATLNGTKNAFVSKFDPTGNALLFSTYLGGNGTDSAQGVAVDNSGNAYVAGTTSSSNFPTTAGAFQTSLKGTSDAFVTKIATATSTFLELQVSPNPAAIGESVTLTAFGLPTNATGSVSFFDGTTLLGTSSVSNGDATLIVDSFSPGTHPLTAVYSGDSNFASSTSPVVNLNVITAEPPRNLKGFQKLEGIRLVNVLKWKAPVGGTPIVKYIVFRNSLDHKIGKVTHLQNLKFKDYKIEEGKTYTYYVVSVDSFGNKSAPAKVVVKSIIKKKRDRR